MSHMGLGGEPEAEIYPSPRKKRNRAPRAFKSILTTAAKGVWRMFYVIAVGGIALGAYLFWRWSKTKDD